MSNFFRNESGIRKLKIVAIVMFCIIGALVVPVLSYLADGVVDSTEVILAVISFFLALSVAFAVIIILKKRK
ncbi:MAG: hypothetical protein ACJAYG_000676 [Oceanicoccus sp.]|jgi:hypothetical protein